MVNTMSCDAKQLTISGFYQLYAVLQMTGKSISDNKELGKEVKLLKLF